MQTLSCPNCAATVPAGYLFCPMCGTKLDAATAAPTPQPTPPAQAAGPAYPPQYPAAAQPAAASQTARIMPEGFRVGPDAPLPEGWSEHKDSWNGFDVAVPRGWQVTALDGRILVHEGPTYFISALLWPLRLPQPVPAQQVAAQFIAFLRGSDPSVRAWQQDGAGGDVGHILLRVQSTLNGQPLEGSYTVAVEGQNALISGFACPPGTLGNRGPLFARILSSFKPQPPTPRQPVREPGEGAYTAQIPQGWTFSGGISRTSGSGAVQFSALRDQQGIVAAVIPVMSWMYVDGMAGGFGFGGMGGPQNMPYVPAAQFAAQQLPQWMSQFNRDLRVEGIEDRPDLTMMAQAQLAAGGFNPANYDSSVATLTTTYSEANTRLLQKTQLSVLRPHTGYGVPSTWSARIENYYRAPVAEFMQLEPTLVGILSSIVMAPAWQQGEQQQLQNYMRNAQLEQNRRYQEMSKTISETNDIINQSYQDRQASQDRNNQAFGNLMRGTQDMTDDQGNVYNVPANYDRYWVDATNTTVYGGSWATTTPESDWKPLEPTGT